ncbi:zeatin O-glucosyltransferase-like [Bidens hawaiensis]|uniref:zeatin O-glucosyltransferase-like n=1 Tax=Bidens hawaiensis TaxID=980011 RepID=UPI00404B63EF
MAAIDQPNIAVVVVPFPAQGHLNQLLHLSRLISAYNVPVHVITTTTHGRQANTRIPLSLSTNIHFHHHTTPHFPSPPPDPTAATKFPTQLIPAFQSAMHLRQPFNDFLSTLSPSVKRMVVIYDYLMGTVVQDVILHANVEAYMFSSCSAFAGFWYRHEAAPLDDELAAILKELPTNEDCFSIEGYRFIASTDVSWKKFSSGTIFDASRVIEGKYLNLIEQVDYQDRQKLWALGPFNPVEITNDPNHKRHKLFDWLKKQTPDSVLYVSFGTTTSISNEQIQEIALGLEESKQKFIWVLRDADKGDIFDSEVRMIELPDQFEERVGENGLVVVDWVPQLEILSHRSTGGFMSHCGWNSCMESMTMGVPVAAWPMHSDQPHNAMLITNVLNIGIYVRDWTQRKELVSSKVVKEVVGRLMVSDEGVEMRKRAAELGNRIRRSMMDGGVARVELDSFVAHVSR